MDGITLSPTLTTSQTGSQRVVVSKNSVFVICGQVEWDKKEARHGRKRSSPLMMINGHELSPV